jgi:hypothetical protein
MRAEDLEKRALSLPGAVESAHFGKRDFRVGKRIFMSLPEAGRAVFKFTPDQQRMLIETEPSVCAAVPGSWGEKGWTSVWFMDADEDIIEHVMDTAWRNVAPKTLQKTEVTLQKTEELLQKSEEPAE